MNALTLPWHQELLTSLGQELESGRLPHSIGLTAANGWGLSTFVESFVRQVLSLGEGQPISEVAHPDLLWVEPDGAMLKIDQIREVRDYAIQTPQIAPRKIVVLLHAELMNIESANALLKTLEEPPPNTLILLCSEYWGRLLPTIRSRCQRREIQGSQGQTLAWLKEQGLEVNSEYLALVGYAPLAAVDEAFHRVEPWLDQIAKGGVGGIDFNSLPEDLVGWLGVMYRIILKRAEKLLDSEKITATQVIERANAAYTLLDFGDEVLAARRQLQTKNFNTKVLLVESLAYRWSVLASRVEGVT